MRKPENENNLLHNMLLVLLYILFFPVGGVLAQTSTELPTIFDLIQGEELVEAELELNIDSLILNRMTEDRIPGAFRFTDSLGQSFSLRVEVNVRGRFRRTACEFPPLKLNFKKEELGEYGLDEHNNLKLVTHCLGDWRGEDYLLREYLAYRMYRILTDTSYRTQLLRIKYTNTADGKSFSRFGFVLEDEKELADRLDSELCEDCFSVPKEHFIPQITTILDLFQYMIGNADWSPMILRNLKLLKPEEGGKFVLIPYDFDFSGLVSPYYAVPHPYLGISTVKDRIYLGFPHNTEEFRKAYNVLISNRERFYECIGSFDYLKRSSRRSMRKYLDSFFERMGGDQPAFDQLVPVSLLGPGN